MASENVKSNTKPSTSTVPDTCVNSAFITKLTKSLKTMKGILDVDEVIRTLTDEYKKLTKANPVSVEQVELENRSKSKVKSIDLRKIAESYAKIGSHCESLTRYTQSIAYAEDGSEELALAYAKRAKSLYRLGLYDQCVDDINRALAGKYPADLRKKLQDRQYQCFIERRKANTKSQVKLVAGPGSSFGVVEVTAGAREEAEREWRDMCKFENARIPNTSSKIRLGYDEKKWGRYVEAAEDLEPGEVVTNQEWYAAFLRLKFKYVRCSHCLKLCAALIPCPTCSQTMYCSENCRDLAYESYHRLECEIKKLLLKPEEIEDTRYRLALRILLVGTAQGAELGNLMQRMTVRDLLKEADPPTDDTFIDEYATHLRLQKKYFPQTLKNNVPHVARMIVVLKYAGYFNEDPSLQADPEHQDTLTEAQIFAAFLLLNNFVGTLPHYWYLSYPKSNNKSSTTFDHEVFGSFYFTLCSVFKHSCYTNTYMISRDQKVAIVASRPIKKGEQLFLSYEYIACSTEDLGSRLLKLAAYHGFICQCVACLNDWPLGDSLARTPVEFHNNIKQKSAKWELKTLISPILVATKLPFKEILRVVFELCKWLFTNIKQPAYEHILIQNLERSLMMLRYEDFGTCVTVEDIIQCQGATLMQFLRRLNIDVNSIPAPVRKRKKKRR